MSGRRLVIHPRIDGIPAPAWNALVRDNHPFLRHEFLQALEAHGCVGDGFGWRPCHIALYEGERLIGAMPLYEKDNGYGEFVFDQAWADAYRRAGLDYYPKLVSAVPYTPAAGQRLLYCPGRGEEVSPVLLQAAEALCRERGASGVHLLFPDRENLEFLVPRPLLVRHDCQFHWHNRGYRDFDDFLARLTARKRKKIRQERRRVREAGVTLRRLDGHRAGDRAWRDFGRFYRRLFEEKWGMATLNEGFFRQVAAQLPGQTLLVLADQAGECIAGALMYRSDDTLYGRHWGAVREVHALHFEACYYQGIEYCIEHGLRRFEPGAQGEHKLARGFLPTLTRSCHWLADCPFQPAIAAFVAHERDAVDDYMARMEASTPYRREHP